MKLSLKHIYLYSLIGLGASTLASCDSFLDREPITSVTPEAYFSTVDQVGAYVINYIPGCRILVDNLCSMTRTGEAV